MNILCLLLASVATDCAALSAQATCEAFPDADTVLLNEIEKVEYWPDGTSETWDESWTKILTEKGRRNESTTSLSYSRRYGTGEIALVSVIGTNGVERTIDISRTMRDSTDNSSMSSNIYDPLDRNIVCRIPGLQIGEILHVKTHRKALKPRTQGKWADLSVMEWSCPILKSTYEVKAPAALPIRRKTIRHPLGNIVSSERKESDGSIVHTFVVTNSPQAFPEPDMPTLYTQMQHIRLSTSRDWPEISRWYWQLSEGHLAKTNEAMKKKVDALVAAAKALRKGNPSPEQDPVVRALFKFVSQEVRYMGLTMEDTSPGYAPHDVNTTFDNRYGVCRDKAALLVAMLRMAGYRAFPVLIQVGAKLDSEVPQPFFNHAIVAVEKPGASREYALMDPTNENTKDIFPSYLCNMSYLVARPEGEELKTSPIIPAAANSLDVATSGTLSKDGSLFMKNEISFGGINDTAYRSMLVKNKPEDRMKFFDRAFKKLAPGSQLVSCEIYPKDLRDTEKPLKVSLSAKLPERILRGESRDLLNVPFLSKKLGIVNFLLMGNTSLESRRYPLSLDSTARVRETIRLELGESLGPVVELPEEENAKSGSFGLVRRFSVTNGVLAVEREIAVTAVEIPARDYAGLRESVKRLEAAERKRPVFARDALSEAHVRILFSSQETSIASDREWVTTNTTVKQVLTYDGKKKSAELKFDYNPTWKSVDLISAVVSNRDGSVHVVTPREMNVMDAGWVASAPRYPAGKVLVVNLPSVEIGSVISYQTVVTVTNAPASFYASYYFDTTEPVDHCLVRVNDWKREEKNLKMLPNEPGQPYGALWRDLAVVSSNRFSSVDFHVGKVNPKILGREFATKATARPQPKLKRLVAIRNWMAKNVRIVGPGLFDVPLEQQLTPPEVVIQESYATRLDYIRTLTALLRGAGFEADVVLSQINWYETDEMRRREKFEKPNVRAYASALCRVRLHHGGVFGIFDETETYFIGTENQYAPLGATAFAGSDYFDPEDCTFGVVTVPDEKFLSLDTVASDIEIRESGAADMTIVAEKWGSGVAAFRKNYIEMLPEDRSRHYQALLGGIAQAASATSDLVTDTESYPAKRSFSCYIPDYATVGNDTITLQLPALDCPIPSLAGSVRLSPFAVANVWPEEQRFSIRFPEGYVEIEHLPESFVFEDPSHPNRRWLEARVTTSVKENVLTVNVVRVTKKRPYSFFSAKYGELIRDWRRIGTSDANRTIVVRRR